MTTSQVKNAPPARTAPARGRRPRTVGRHTGGFLLTLPALLVTAALVTVPLIGVVVASVGGGLDAYRELLRSPDFGLVMRNTLVWTGISVLGAMVLGFGAALLLQHRLVRLRAVWRTLLLLPWVFPSIVVATVWKWFYSSEFGMLNHFLLQAGLVEQPVGWLSDPSLVLPALAWVQVWATFPFVMLMVSAGLQSIPTELVEAARIDGAGPVAVFRHVILPGLAEITFVVALMTLIWSVNSFTVIWLATQGGPASASTTISVLIYQAFQSAEQSRVAAIAVVQLLLTLAIAVVYARRSRTAED